MSSVSSDELLRNALTQNPKAVQKAIDKLLCQQSLRNFVEVFWPELEPHVPLVPGWPLDAICEHLEAISYGDINRLCMNVCPGFMKSLLVSVFWPAWEWGPLNKPGNRFISTSYSQNLTIRDNIKFKNIITSDLYRAFWGHQFSPSEDQFTKIKVGNTKTGWKIASSVGGTITGERGNRFVCLPHSAMILTDKGYIKIGDIVEQELSVRVAGWSGDAVEWQNIESFQTNPTRTIVEIDFGDGTFRCTEDHRVFVVGRGWTAAGEIQPGEELSKIGDADLRILSEGIRRTARSHWQEPVLQPGVSLQKQDSQGYDRECLALPDMWNEILPSTRTRSAHASFVLQPSVPGQGARGCGERNVSRWGHDQNLLGVQEGIRDEAVDGSSPRVLLDKMQERPSSAESGGTAPCHMSDMREGIPTPTRESRPVFEGVREQGSLGSNDGQGQWPVRPWSARDGLSARLDEDLSREDSRQGRQQVSALLDDAGGAWQAPMRPSHRLRQGQSGPDESHDAVQVLSREDARPASGSPGLETRIVRSVRNLGITEPATFNVSVTPHHNYFVEGILVKNCDDPNAVNEVESDSIRDSTNTWFRETVPTRLNNQDKDAILVIQQRVHELDVTGLILDLGLPYTHLVIPMEYDSGRHCVTVLARDNMGHPEYVWEDPRGLDEDGNQLEGAALDAADGTIAWPERYSEPAITALKETLGPYAYSGQFQQMPNPRGGGIFKRDWWKAWPPEEWSDALQDKYANRFPDWSYVVASLDPALTSKQENDYSALTIWGVWRMPLEAAKTSRVVTDDGGGFMRITDAETPRLMLMHAWQKRLELHGPPEQKPANMTDELWNSPLMILERQKNWGLVEMVAHSCRRFKVDLLLIENKGGGQHVSSELQRLLSAWDWGINLVDPGGQDKVSRAHGVVHLFSNGVVYAPLEKDWCDLVVSQAARFPRGKSDDLVDSMTQALSHLRETRWALRKEEAEADFEDELRVPSRSRPLYPV